MSDTPSPPRMTDPSPGRLRKSVLGLTMSGHRDRNGRAVGFRGVTMRRFAARCAAAASVAVLVAGSGVAVASARAPAGAVLSVPGAGAVRIVRDEYGVPHVFASTARGLFYGEGYAVAQDRLWQAELLRRTGTGTLAAVRGLGGSRAVSGDVYYREYTGGQDHLRALVCALPASAQVAVQAFSDGMNTWIRSAIRPPCRRSMPRPA